MSSDSKAAVFQRSAALETTTRVRLAALGTGFGGGQGGQQVGVPLLPVAEA